MFSIKNPAGLFSGRHKEVPRSKQRGILKENSIITRCKQRRIDPSTSSPSPLLLKEKGTGVEVNILTINSISNPERT
jgi:hypothetical protein